MSFKSSISTIQAKISSGVLDSSKTSNTGDIDPSESQSAEINGGPEGGGGFQDEQVTLGDVSQDVANFKKSGIAPKPSGINESIIGPTNTKAPLFIGLAIAGGLVIFMFRKRLKF